MTIRENVEKWEEAYLSPYAAISNKSKGRETDEPPCDIRPVYQRDRDRILHSKSFRRMRHKTQVFLSPEGDHYRTRLTHTLEVSQTARTIAKALRLNEDLTEAIALGHDLGHTPFGHAGERALDMVCPKGFAHHRQSVRVLTVLEKGGEGLNVTQEVLDGILNHQTDGRPETLEGKIVRLADKIAYTNHDMEDAVRAGVIQESDIPKELRDILGNSRGERLNTLIHDMIKNNIGKNDILLSPDIHKALYELRSFLFNHVYRNPIAKGQEEKAVELVKQLYAYYRKDLNRLPEEYLNLITKRGEEAEQVVCDYVAGMTDNYAIRTYSDCFIPNVWK